MNKKIKQAASVILIAAFISLIAFGCGSAPAQDGSSSAPVNTGTAADFTVTDINGNTVKLSDYFGKPIVVNFWATWCGPCCAELPEFNSAYEKYGDEIVFMMVNMTDGYRDSVDSVNSFVAENGYSFPIYFDTESSAASAYGISSIPMTMFINKDGVQANSHLGSMNAATLEEYISELTAA